MRLREVTEETRNKYLNEIATTTRDYDAMIKSINLKFAKYGLLHHQQTQKVLDFNYAKTNKEALKVDIKNINTSTLDQIVATLKGIKERYIKEVAPASAITDPMELSFIEKELAVMTDREFIDYYKENYLDSNIVRLCNIENKARHGNKENKIFMPLPEYGVDDFVTAKIDSEIKKTVGMRQVTSSMCSFVGSLDENGTTIPKIVSWDLVFAEIEHRNLREWVKVSLVDFIQ